MNEVEEVKNKTEIVAIIGEHVRLTKAGRNFKGLCPFHEEKSPSFMVSPELQIYKCFGCGEAGDVFTFLEKHEGMEFYDALVFLAEKAGVKLTPRSTQDTSIKTQIIEANKLASQFYHYLLTRHALGKEGLKYIKEKRGLATSTIEKFGIGAAPRNPDILFNFLTKKRKIRGDVVEQAGLVFKTRSGYMDRFRERVIFPISNHRGEVIALAGRILPEYDTGKVGKYINSPETPVYRKSSSLYGLNITKDDIRKAKVAVVVEGELDMLSLWQTGIKNVVAIKGTAMTVEHVRILSRFADTLIMALDSDFAGDSAALRGLSFAQNAGLEIKVVSLGKYKDPDEFARSDPKGMTRAIGNSVDAWEFVISVISKRFDLSTGAGKAKASKQLVPVLATIEDNIVRSHYLQKAALKLGVPVDAVNREVSKQNIAKKDEYIGINKPIDTQKSRRELLEERLLVLYSHSGKVKPHDVEIFLTPLAKKIYKNMLLFGRNDRDFNSNLFLEELPQELKAGYSDIVIKGSLEEAKDVKKEITIIERELMHLTLKEGIAGLTGQIAALEAEGKNKEVKMLEKKFRDLSGKLSVLREK